MEAVRLGFIMERAETCTSFQREQGLVRDSTVLVEQDKPMASIRCSRSSSMLQCKWVYPVEDWNRYAALEDLFTTPLTSLLPISKPFVTPQPILALMVPFLSFSLAYLGLICMFCRIENVDREF